MRTKMMITLRILIFVLWLGCCASDVTTKERIERNKAWLEQRALIKMYKNSTHKNDYYRKIIKFYDNESKNRAENEIVFPPKNRRPHQYENDSYEVIEDSINNTTLAMTSTTARVPQTTRTAAIRQQISSTVNEMDATTPSMTNVTATRKNVSKKPSSKKRMSKSSGKKVNKKSTPATKIPTTTTSSTSTTTTTTATTSTTLRPFTTILPVSSDEKETSKRTDRKKFVEYKWSPWSKWGTCSRSCGSGVKIQTRHCLSKSSDIVLTPNNDTSLECIGIFRRYHICNEQNCSSNLNTDFRAEQCTHFNTHVFQGKQYEWEPYIKDDAECELNCKPLGINYFATLNETVIDGTPCTKPVDIVKHTFIGRAICVEGSCKVVHNSGVISGSFMNNGAVRCGTLVCRQISGIFSKTKLPNGYVHVATIPTGASNISISEMKHSANFLVLKSVDHKFIMNGDHRISSSGTYEAAGAHIDYHRIDGITNHTIPGHRKIEGITEWITATGPTTEPLNLMVLAQHPNPGIKYEYLLPIHPNMISSDEDSEISSSENDIISTSEMASKLKSGTTTIVTATNSTTKPKRKRQFLWKVIGFNACSKSCGGGIQTPIIKCVREAPTRIFSPKRCSHLRQPVLNENIMKCNSQPCPAYWKAGEWNNCECDEHSESVFQTRDLKCVQELGSGMIIQVNNGACLEDAPLSRQKCECPKYMKTPQLEVYKHVKPHHHTPSEINTIRNNIHGIPKNHTTTTKAPVVVEVNKKQGIWLTSEWNEQCSTDCGTGIQYRTIFCDRAPPFTDRCDMRVTPDTTRQCSADKNCKTGEWFIGPWGECTGDCFNLKKTRQTYCIHKETIVSDAECNITAKPESSHECPTEDVKDCRPKWHYSDWTACTKTCGGGTQKRTVKCFEPNAREKQLKETQNCKYAERPIGYRNCNAHSCSEEQPKAPEMYSEPRVDLIQNDITPECTDQYPNCNLVIKARLCNYAYYYEQCCHSCQYSRLEI